MDFLSATSAYEAGVAMGKILSVVIAVGLAFGGGVFFIISLIKVIRLKTTGWIICCIISGVLSLFGLLGSLGMATQAALELIENSNEATSAKKRLASADQRISIEVPELWKTDRRLHDNSILEATDRLEQTCVMVLADAKEDFVGNLQEFDELTVGGMEDSLDDPSISEPENRLIGGFPAIYRRIIGTTDLTKVVYHRISIESSEGFYQVLTWTAPSREAKTLPLLMDILDSCKITTGIPSDLEPVPPELDTLSRVTGLVSNLLEIDAASVHENSRWVEDLGADELDTVELVMAAEEAFRVTIPEEDVSSLKTVGDLVRWLDRHLSGQR